MPTVLKIFTSSEILSFDSPPRFTGAERKKFFRLSKNMQRTLSELRTPTNKIGFILQFGYFKATNRFVRIRSSYREDILFICRNFNILSSDIHFDKYTSETFNRQRRILLSNFGFKEFNEDAKALLIDEALALCSTLKKPKAIFLSLIEWLGERKIECPRYFTIAEIITNALKEFEYGLLSSIEEKITTQEKLLLDNLLKVNDTYLAETKKDIKYKRYNITFLKKNNQSISPQKIKENIKKLQTLKKTFDQIYPIFERLGLDSRTIDYYANISIKSNVFQISRRSRNKYLLLISFVVHQYYTLNDLLIDILIHVCQKIKNTARNKHKEQCYDRREGNDERISMITKKTISLLEIIKLITKIIYTPHMSESRMIKEIRAILPQKEPDAPSSLEKEVERMTDESRTDSDKDYYEILAEHSRQIQHKVSNIIKTIEFDEKTSNKNIIKAINYYKAAKGKIDQEAPLDHLHKTVLKYMFADGKIQKSLYKVSFFDAVSNNIKSGALNLKHSYKYRPFEDYLIPFSSWSSNKDAFIERAGLSQFKNFTEVMSALRPMLEERYRLTNENILNEKNPYVKFNTKGQCMVSTPPADTEEADKLADYFPKNRYITLYEVLSTVDNVEQFTDCFEYWQVKHNKKKPSKRILYAGIIGHGCNLGINRIARSSQEISAKELENINTWYFGVNNINNANNKILNIMEQLHLPDVYQRDPSKVHTSSDGQKFNVSVDSMNANYSFKYFGKGKGVNVCSFIDELHRLFHSDVISPAIREAAYVIDGILHNDVIKSDIHSTDTHGYTELVFAIMYLLGIAFAPRIKNLKKQRLYCFGKVSLFKSTHGDYKVKPNQKINEETIEENWDNILRIVATIKLKKTTASQLFQRLSSYSQQHPHYKALKSFGQIIKTEFILRYIDMVELRQAIMKQLNKGESSNRFTDVIHWYENQEIRLQTKKEQDIAQGCTRLIKNAIICWNYLYLSDLILNTNDPNERKSIIKAVKNGSIVRWQHINIQGEYDFSDEILKNSYKFSLPKLRELEIS